MATKTKAAQNGQAADLTTTVKARAKATVPLFKIVKENDFDVKIANMDHPLVCQTKGVIEIECLKKSNFIETRVAISRVNAKDLGIVFGVPLGKDEKTGQIKWQRFVIGDSKRYDLSKRQDAVEWAVVSRAPWLVGSPYQKGKPLYKKYDREEEAREHVKRVTIREKAMDILKTMVTIDDMPDMLRNFGKNPSGLTPLMVQSELLKVAERSPEDFVDIWENANRSVITIFNRSKDLGIITFDIVKGGYLFKNTLPIGITEQAAIKYLTENKQVLATADMESKSKDHVGNNFIKNAKLNKANIDADDSEVADEEESVELLNLRIEASLMGIEGVGLMNEEQLIAAIEEKSSQ